MKAFLYFFGSAIKWMGSDLSRFAFFHLYLLSIYLFTLFAKSASLDIYRFIFTVGILSPFLLAINKGLPLNCLNLDSAISKELSNNEI